MVVMGSRIAVVVRGVTMLMRRARIMMMGTSTRAYRLRCVDMGSERSHGKHERQMR